MLAVRNWRPEAKRSAIIDHNVAGWKISDIARAVGLARKTVYAVLREAA
jgi:DNA-directed RNA polymerase specialized sigma24 family protein